MHIWFSCCNMNFDMIWYLLYLWHFYDNMFTFHAICRQLDGFKDQLIVCRVEEGVVVTSRGCIQHRDPRTACPLANGWNVTCACGLRKWRLLRWVHMSMALAIWSNTWLFNIAGWWFGTIFIFPYIGNSHPNWGSNHQPDREHCQFRDDYDDWPLLSN